MAICYPGTMLRLQSRATQLRQAAGSQLSQMVSGVRPTSGHRLPEGVLSCKYSTPSMRDLTTPEPVLREGPIKKLMVANRGMDSFKNRVSFQYE